MVKIATARKIFKVYTQATRLLSDFFSVLFDMSQNIFSYLVSRKIKVYNNVWLLKKKVHVFWEMDPESW